MWKLIYLIVALASCASILWSAATPSEISELRTEFAKPPADARIMMRWWWFGPAVTKPEIERELRVMQDAGIGGVEIQPVYPLALDDPKRGFRNLPYLSDEFIDALRFASSKAHELGMRVDITLGSGWPYGGPATPVTEAAGRLRYEQVQIPADARSIPTPSISTGERFIAAFIAPGDEHNFSSQKVSLESLERLTDVKPPRLSIPHNLSGPRVALFFISSRTGMQVKRAGVGAEGFVLDHYDRSAIENHLTRVGDRLMQGFGSTPPYAVFSDSLEVFASDWTGNLLDEFRKRRGYDLTPYLPALVGDIGERTGAIRHDWGETLTELAEEHYLTPIREWAHAHGTQFRSQTYGVPPVVLSSNSLVDLPEGEGPHWRNFGTARWAASASHLYGRPVTSSETWTWLHSPAFRATPLDMKAEADLHFLQGVNQLIGHGWPYSPPSAGNPGWRFYAAAAFNEHNPWFQVMPDVTAYLQRVSFLLRQGRPANDVAVYLPSDDAWAGFKAWKDSVDRSMNALLGAELIPQILNAGYNFDFIDDRAIASVGIPYRILVLPGVERISYGTLQRLQAYVKSGGAVVATRRLPSLAPGLLDTKSDTARIVALSESLFGGTNEKARFVKNEQVLGKTLTDLLPPDFATGAAGSAIGFVHRNLSLGDIYFVANTTNQPVETKATVRVSGMAAEWWNPFTGETRQADTVQSGNNTTLSLKLAPYESRILVFSKSQMSRPPVPEASHDPAIIDISADWKVSFSSINETQTMKRLHSWSTDEATRFYSGLAVYEKTVELPESIERPGSVVVMNFGAGTPVEAAKRTTPGMRALLDSPVRESAVVYIRGQKAGSVWHPPYEVDVTRLLHSGANQIRIVVANTAINTLAGRAPKSYRLLNLRYVERFVPQDMDNLVALPSGILGPIRLVVKTP
jgi:alpha-L-rhamnosidase